MWVRRMPCHDAGTALYSPLPALYSPLPALYSPLPSPLPAVCSGLLPHTPSSPPALPQVVPAGGGQLLASGRMWVAPAAESDPSALSFQAEGRELDPAVLAEYYLPQVGGWGWLGLRRRQRAAGCSSGSNLA